MQFNDAKYLPIRVKWNVKTRKLFKGTVIIKGELKKSMIKLGYSGTEFIPYKISYIYIGREGKLIFNGECKIAEGFNIYINNGTLELGRNVYVNRNLQIQCEKYIKIGDKSLLGWNLNIRDTDGHPVVCNGQKRDKTKEIIIGDKVWLASDSTVLKGTNISNGSILATNSVICGYICEENNCLLAGIPAKVKKKNVEWIE